MKPEPEIFLEALRQVEAEAGEAVYADDRADLVAAARGLGLDAFLVTSPGSLERDLARRGLLSGNSDPTGSVLAGEAP